MAKAPRGDMGVPSHNCGQPRALARGWLFPSLYLTPCPLEIFASIMATYSFDFGVS